MGSGGTFAGWAAAVVLGLVGALVPGAECETQNLSFAERPNLGDTLTFNVTVATRDPAAQTVSFDCRAGDQRGRQVLVGTVTMRTPSDAEVAQVAHRAGPSRPEIAVHGHRGYQELLDRCAGTPPLTTAVVWPLDHSALTAAVEAAGAGLITPILVGAAAGIQRAADAADIDISKWPIVDAATDDAAASAGARLVREGTAGVLMKGSLHTNTMLRAVLSHEGGLRESPWISHVFVFDVPTYPKPLLLSDAVVAIAPTLEQKAVICRHAIKVAHALGIARPKVAILSAIEDVDPAIPSTIDAAALCKMADRGQITGAVLDGPLAMDNAISMASAATKGIVSAVAGDADILIVPNLEAGNILYKNLTYLAEAEVAGVIVGASVPIILASRADSVRTRIASAALASILAGYRPSEL